MWLRPAFSASTLAGSSVEADAPRARPRRRRRRAAGRRSRARRFRSSSRAVIGAVGQAAARCPTLDAMDSSSASNPQSGVSREPGAAAGLRGPLRARAAAGGDGPGRRGEGLRGDDGRRRDRGRRGLAARPSTRCSATRRPASSRPTTRSSTSSSPTSRPPSRQPSASPGRTGSPPPCARWSSCSATEADIARMAMVEVTAAGEDARDPLPGGAGPLHPLPRGRPHRLRPGRGAAGRHRPLRDRRRHLDDLRRDPRRARAGAAAASCPTWSSRC